MKVIKLTQGKEAIVCDCHYDLVKDYKWAYATLGYAQGYDKKVRRLIYMHRVINNTPLNLLTDHIDMNRLNNQCKNLRSVTKSQNLLNRGFSKNSKLGVKGVHQVKSGKFKVQLAVNHKQIHLGYFNTILEAIRVYEEAALKYHGIYARLK